MTVVEPDPVLRLRERMRERHLIPLRRDFPVGGDPVEFSQEHQEWQTAPSRA